MRPGNATHSWIPTENCPIVREQRLIPLIGPYPPPFLAMRTGGPVWYIDRSTAKLTDPTGKEWLLEPATIVTCQHHHRHLMALRFQAV